MVEEFSKAGCGRLDQGSFFTITLMGGFVGSSLIFILFLAPFAYAMGLGVGSSLFVLSFGIIALLCSLYALSHEYRKCFPRNGKETSQRLSPGEAQ